MIINSYFYIENIMNYSHFMYIFNWIKNRNLDDLHIFPFDVNNAYFWNSEFITNAEKSGAHISVIIFELQRRTNIVDVVQKKKYLKNYYLIIWFDWMLSQKDLALINSIFLEIVPSFYYYC